MKISVLLEILLILIIVAYGANAKPVDESRGIKATLRQEVAPVVAVPAVPVKPVAAADEDDDDDLLALIGGADDGKTYLNSFLGFWDKNWIFKLISNSDDDEEEDDEEIDLLAALDGRCT